jgi:AcrR family transcriptional regulator
MRKPAKLQLVEGDATARVQKARERTQATKKLSRQDQILSTAAKMFNEAGVGAVGLSDVAKQMGLSRASFYHYVADRDDLIFRCFQKSHEADTERLDRAERARPGLPQVLRYMQESLAEQTKLTAIVTDTGLLSQGPRDLIEKARRRNFERIASMVGEGVRLGNIRPCDEQLLGRVLPSMVAFYHMSGRWIDASRNLENAASVIDFVAHGTATDREAAFEFRHGVDSFSRVGIAGLDSLSIADIRIEQLLMTGSKLINTHGADNFSLDDIVAALGVTRGTFYHYFSDKSDFVRKCLERGYDLYAAFIDYADLHGQTGLEKSLILSHLNIQAQVGPLQPVAAWMGFEVLTPALRSRFTDRLRKLLARSDTFAEEGIADGSRRSGDFRATNVARAGSFLWIPKWIHEIDNPSPHRVANEIVSFFQRGLAPSD